MCKHDHGNPFLTMMNPSSDSTSWKENTQFQSSKFETSDANKMKCML